MSGWILVTPRSATRDGHPALHKLADAGYEAVFCRPGVLPSEEELLALLPGCTGYLAGVEDVPGRVLEAAKELRAISRNGTGADAIDTAAALPPRSIWTAAAARRSTPAANSTPPAAARWNSAACWSITARRRARST